MQGLVLPPKMAPQQVVVIPIPNSKMPEDARKVSDSTLVPMHVAVCKIMHSIGSPVSSHRLRERQEGGLHALPVNIG